MSKDTDELEKKPKRRFVILLFLIIALITSLFAIYELYLLSSIETLIRYIIMGFLVFIDLIFIFKTKRFFKPFKKKKKKKKKSKGIMLIIFMILYSLVCGFVGGAIFYVYGEVSNINKVYVTYSSSLVTMSKNSADKVSDIKDYKIGILKDKTSPEGYIIPQEIIKENNLNDNNEIKKYDDYSTMLVDLYSGEIDAMFTSSSYVSMFSSITGYENIQTDTKVIITKDKKMKKSDASINETASSGKSIKEPFTILLMGIDSTDEVLSKNAIANGDTLILVTFNPKTLNATMISIPRDSYVPIACWPSKDENKITHAAGYGTDCMMNTIEEYFDVNIDYYAKINFKGLVKLVDAVGGVDVEVPKKLCTDDSSRGGQVCIQEGKQHLNGEEALVFARNRKQLAEGDFGRAKHQQEIVVQLVNKMKDITEVSKFMEILNTVSNSIDTNLTTKQILSFYNIAKDIVKKSLAADDADLVNIQQLYLAGNGQMIYDERMRMVLWDYVPNKDSKKDIIRAMKENLELVDHKPIKEFSFSANDPYEKKIIGEGPYKTSYTYKLLPSFIGDSESAARSYANANGIRVTFKGSGGHVVSQSVSANKRIDKITGSVVLTLSGSTSNTTSTTTKNSDKNENTSKDTSKETSEKPSTPGKDDDSSNDKKNNDIKPGDDSDTTGSN